MAKEQHYKQQKRFEPDPIVFKTIEDMSAISGQEICKRARATAEALVRGDRLQNNQLRNIYSSIDSMRTVYQRHRDYNAVEDQLWLLRPKLAYAAGRQKAVNNTLFPFMSLAIDGVINANNKEEALKRFFALIESVVGYHKYFENI